MMRKYFINILLALGLGCAVSCTFDNDMSYPVIEAQILSFEVEGGESVNIDPQIRTVEIVLDELAELDAVRVLECTVSDGVEIVGGMPEVLDLSTPKSFILRTYQDYEWTISAIQPVERYIYVDNQASATEFNLSENIAIVYVTDNQRLQNVTFNSMKLEREGAEFISTTGFINEGGVSKEVIQEVTLPMTKVRP